MEKPCAVCAGEFTPHPQAPHRLCCSPACQRVYRRGARREWDRTHARVRRRLVLGYYLGGGCALMEADGRIVTITVRPARGWEGRLSADDIVRIRFRDGAAEIALALDFIANGGPATARRLIAAANRL